MATGKQNSFVLYDAQYQMGKYEALARHLDAFNSASRNAIRLVTRNLAGEFERQAFFDQVSGLISRRDLGSVAAADDLPLTQDEEIGVKINRKIGPVGQTLNSFRKIGMTDQERSFVLGQLVGENKRQDLLDTGLMGLQAALAKQASTQYDATGQATATMTHAHLVNGLAKLGDAAGRIVCWLMHSKVYFDLVSQALADNLYTEAGMVVYGGQPGTLGRPVIVTDSPALVNDNDPDPDTYNTLGLTADSLVVTESEEEELVVETVTGMEQLIVRWQGEYAFNLRVKGFKFDTAQGGNPDDATIADSASWAMAVSDPRNAAGIQIVTA